MKIFKKVQFTIHQCPLQYVTFLIIWLYLLVLCIAQLSSLALQQFTSMFSVHSLHGHPSSLFQSSVHNAKNLQFDLSSLSSFAQTLVYPNNCYLLSIPGADFCSLHFCVKFLICYLLRSSQRMIFFGFLMPLSVSLYFYYCDSQF